MIEKYTNGAWAELGKYHKYGTENYDVSTFPASMLTTGNDFEDYRIYGASGGVGEQTENLCYRIITNATIDSNGRIVYDTSFDVALAPVYQDSSYSALNPSNVYAWFMAEPYLGSQSYNQSRNAEVLINKPSPLNGFVAVRYAKANSSNAMVIEGSTAPTSYIPHGYQLNVVVGDGTTETTTPIYIGDTPLEEGEYVDYDTQKIYKYVDGVLTPTDPPVALPAIPTLDGTTVIDFNNSPKPDRMTAEDTGWFGHKPKIYTNGQWVDMT